MLIAISTNKVGTFDEAFKSRIHMSLYYKPLSWDQTHAIWKVNLRRIKDVRPDITFEEDKLLKWVKKSWKTMEKEDRRPLNGRQIHNAVRTAAALAAFDSKDKVLTKEHLKSVDKASRQFDQYLHEVHGTDDIGLAERNLVRADDKFADIFRAHLNTPTPSTRTLATSSKRSSKSDKKSKKRASPSPEASESGSSASDSDSDN